MKRFLLIIPLSFAILGALSLKPAAPEKALSGVVHEAGSLKLQVNNYGHCDELYYPRFSRHNLLYKGAMWIGGKIQRRDEEGRRLFWLHPDPYIDAGITHEGSPEWNADLKPVIDSLTSVGYEGALDIMELLPAYNTKAYSDPRYNEYNHQDVVLRSILGYPSPRTFEWPDPFDNYCFSIPQPFSHESPGLETLTGFFYDFCPLGTEGNRVLGSGSSHNSHFPLGLGIKRESFAWNLQNHDRFVIFRITLYNMNEYDTIQDLAIGEYVDADIYPYLWYIGYTIDDVSGYDLVGEFAYSRDFDGDAGLSPYWVGHKIICPSFDLLHECWTWKLIAGPNDWRPLNLDHPDRITANEKYWLMTGRDPAAPGDAPDRFVPLRSLCEPGYNYEQSYPSDTYFLNVLYGNQPDEQNPDPEGRLHLAPGDSLTYYSVYFVGEGLQDLRNIAQTIDTFIASGMEIDPDGNLACMPYLKELEVVNAEMMGLHWHSFTNPAHFEVKYKLYEDTAAQWVSIQVPGPDRSHLLMDLDPEAWYEYKVAAVYNPGPDEVYLESNVRMTKMNLSSEVDPEIPPSAIVFENYPNPFGSSTNIKFSTGTAGQLKLRVYNSKGQMVQELYNGSIEPGIFSKLWNGKDSNGSLCTSGLYFLRLDFEGSQLVKKILLLRN